jgi:hypothetical protein
MEMENRPIAFFNGIPRNLLETPALCAVDDPSPSSWKMMRKTSLVKVMGSALQNLSKATRVWIM